MKIYWYDCLESTNITARARVLSGAGHGTIIAANRQTGGKGRYGRSFISPPGGIYMSLILQSGYWRSDTPTAITALAAVAVCEAIEALSDKKPRIKWVNDIYLDDKKISGILAETVMKDGAQWIVVGIGINFNTPAVLFPETLRQIAGSLFPDGDPPITRDQLIRKIADRITQPGEKFYEKEMLSLYRKRLMMLGTTVIVNTPHDSYEATAVDIDDTGKLLVMNESGKITALSSGEISVKFPGIYE